MEQATNSETRNCQNCNRGFVVKPADFDFYNKINVPPPTWCPECRMIRKFLFRNERTWYRRTCDATKKTLLSTFAPESPFKVYDLNYWRSDAWDPSEYGRDVDFSKPFLTQFNELFQSVPHPNLVQKNNVDSEYSNYTLNLKNCYFVASCDAVEDSAYTFTFMLKARNCLDAHICFDIEWCYEAVDCINSNNLRFCQLCEGCVDSWLLFDCRNCTNCVGCVGLRSRQYCIFNEQYSREEYIKKLSELNLDSYSGLAAARRKFETLKASVPRRFANIFQSVNVLGDDIQNSRNVNGFVIRSNSENVHYSYRISDSKDIWDSFVAWKGSELQYESSGCSGQRMICSTLIYGGSDVSYSYNCFDCENIFGCVGLRNKSYCILNKQYSKEEYNDLKSKIVKHMNDMPYVDALGRTYGYGEFFPPEISPFSYNETIAQDYYPSTPEDAAKFGYGWREPDKREYKVTLEHNALPENIQDAQDDILDKTISCAHAGTDCREQCATAFKMVPMELQFYRKMGVPLPRLCPSCRHYGRVKLKGPLKLWQRNCMCKDGSSNEIIHGHGASACVNEFQTPYAPERPEVIYCEQCYNAETV